MRIQNGQPKLLQLNVHTFGALYKYNNVTRNFDFVSGESLDVAGVEFPVKYPDTVNTINGHPEIFVSNGSHGNWGSAGKHNYLTYVDSYTIYSIFLLVVTKLMTERQAISIYLTLCYFNKFLD